MGIQLGQHILYSNTCYCKLLPSGFPFGKESVYTKVGKEQYRASKAHANDCTFQVCRARVNLVNLEETLAVSITTWRRAICGIRANSIRTNKVCSIWCCCRWHPHGCSTCRGKGCGCCNCEGTLLVQLQRQGKVSANSCRTANAVTQLFT